MGREQVKCYLFGNNCDRKGKKGVCGDCLEGNTEVMDRLEKVARKQNLPGSYTIDIKLSPFNPNTFTAHLSKIRKDKKPKKLHEVKVTRGRVEGKFRLGL